MEIDANSKVHGYWDARSGIREYRPGQDAYNTGQDVYDLEQLGSIRVVVRGATLKIFRRLRRSPALPIRRIDINPPRCETGPQPR